VESVIQESLKEPKGSKTVIAIAHRLSTIAAMDHLVVIDEGRIVDEYTHGELLRAGRSLRGGGSADRAASSASSLSDLADRNNLNERNDRMMILSWMCPL
jgi:ATP-binding cassette subfamily B multidrug efflux pump